MSNLSSQNGFGTNTCVANLTSGFIDLATYDELEKYMYGGPDATAYFVRETRKSTWFTQCPVTLARCNGTPEFGAEWSCSISRAGDYLLGTWLHVVTPEVSLKCDASNSVCIAWTPNFMHALVKECCITFNDLVAARFDGTHLDFWAAFTTPASKSEGYKKMIGANLPTHGNYIPSYALNLPLPFFYTRDSGVALPTAALPYNEMRINFVFRQWQEMLMTFRETGNCPNGDYYGPAMAIEHPQTQVSQGLTSFGQAKTQILTVVGPTAPTAPPGRAWVLGAKLTQPGVGAQGASGTIGGGTGITNPGTIPAVAETIIVRLDSGATAEGLPAFSTSGGGGQFNLNGAAVPSGVFSVLAPVDGFSEPGFTQIKQQEKVSRTNYAAPYFCKRNCPVVSAAADQLSIGGAINGFEVDAGGAATAGGTQQTITFITATNPTGADSTVLLNSTVVQSGTLAAGKVVSVTPVVPAGANSMVGVQVIVQCITVVDFTAAAGVYTFTSPDGKLSTEVTVTAAVDVVIPGDTSVNLGGNNVNAGNTNALGLFNDQYAHMNYDAEVCAKCLMMGGQDTGLFTQTLVKQPSLGSNAVQVWANYAIVSNEERKRMACAPRDILIEQVQSTPSQRFGGQTPFPVSSSGAVVQSQNYDIRFSHAIKVLFFGAKNTTFKTVHSNYSTGIPCLSKENCGGCLSIQSLAGQGYGGRGGDQLLYALGLTNGPNTCKDLAGDLVTNAQGSSLQAAGSAVLADSNIHAVCDVVTVNSNVVGCCNAQDPIMNANLVYENTQRLGLMASDYYSQVQPFYHAPAIPDDKTSPVFCAKGYHMYSYSLDFICLDPLGSTNFGKLTNVAINATPASDWGRDACVSNQSLQVLYDTNGNTLPQNFAAGSQGNQVRSSAPPGGNKAAVLADAAAQCAGGLKYTKADGQALSFSIEELLLLNVGTSSTALSQVTGGHALIDSNRNTQKFSFQFVCTAVNNNIIRISGGALGFPVL